MGHVRYRVILCWILDRNLSRGGGSIQDPLQEGQVVRWVTIMVPCRL